MQLALDAITRRYEYVEAANILRAALASAPAQAGDADMREALRDMLDGWKYIRSTHGDLYGVGWDRAQAKAESALATQPPPPAAPAPQVLPPLPMHPEPHTYTWTALELRTIEEYGQECARAALQGATAPSKAEGASK